MSYSIYSRNIVQIAVAYHLEPTIDNCTLPLGLSEVAESSDILYRSKDFYTSSKWRR